MRAILQVLIILGLTLVTQLGGLAWGSAPMLRR
jgi:hypothetical protein